MTRFATAASLTVLALASMGAAKPGPAIYDYVIRHGEMTERQAAMMRLGSTWAIQQSREAVNTLFHCAGSAAVFEEQPFERRLRDIHTVSQQSQGRQLHYESVGQIMLGLPPENQF